jgi:hypothetical protein
MTLPKKTRNVNRPVATKSSQAQKSPQKAHETFPPTGATPVEKEPAIWHHVAPGVAHVPLIG